MLQYFEYVGVQIFEKSRKYLNILGFRKMKKKANPRLTTHKYVEENVKNVVATATEHLSLGNSCLNRKQRVSF